MAIPTSCQYAKIWKKPLFDQFFNMRLTRQRNQPRQNVWLGDVFAELGDEAAGLYIVSTYKNNDLAHGHPSQQSHDDTAKTVADFITRKGLLNS